MAARKPKEMEPPFTPRIVGGTRSRNAKARNGKGALRRRIAALRSSAYAPLVPVTPTKAKTEAARKASAKKRKKKAKKKRKKGKGKTRSKTRDGIRYADSLKPTEPEWLDGSYMPIGAITILSGNPDTGKSVIVCFLAATESSGAPWPWANGLKGGCGNVLMLVSSEDDPDNTVGPRLVRMGAVLSRVAVPELDGQTLADISWLRKLIRDTEARLVIIDHLTAFMPRGKKVTIAADMRAVLDPVARLAREMECVVVVIRHLSQARTSHAIYRGSGSIDVTAIARSELLAGLLVERGSEGVLMQIKTNLRKKAVPWKYRLGKNHIEFTGPCSVRAADILDPPRRADGQLGILLRSLLPCRSKGLVEKIVRAGFTKKAFKRVKKDLGVWHKRISEKGGGRGKGYSVALLPGQTWMPEGVPDQPPG